MKDFIEMVTDFAKWSVYVMSLFSTVALVITGTYEFITEPQLFNLLYFLAAVMSLGIHLTLKIITREE